MGQMRVEIQKEINQRIAKIGLDLEVIVYDNESGDWSRGWENRI